MFRRARLQLALFYAASLAAIVLIMGTAAFLVLRHSLDDSINASLETAHDELQRTGISLVVTPNGTESNNGNNGDGRDKHDDDDHPEAGQVASDVFYAVTDRAGNVLSNPRNVNLAGMPFARLAEEAGGSDRQEDISANGVRYRIVTDRLSKANGGTYFHVGQSLEARDKQLRQLTMVFVIGGAAGVVLAGFGGMWLAGRALVPIRRALQTQQRFVSDASHELRTPIAVVKANNELLLRHPEDTIEASLDHVEAVAAETEHMAHLVEDLLTLARADEGRAALASAALDLGDLVAEIGRDMAALAELRGVHLDVQAAHVQVDGDRQRLRQLAVILLDNALKYTPTGGSVTAIVERVGKHAVLRVRDTGPGIAQEEQHRIFDRFYRIDSARSRIAGGTGLGLPIARWIAEAHKGRLTVSSTPGHGATFTVRLPVRS